MLALVSGLTIPSGPAFAAAPPTQPALTSKVVATITADPPIPRPHTTPVVVQLFDKVEFRGGPAPEFQYNPPATALPWSKIVLEADYACTAGRQYDRTALISIGDTNVYFGTTVEPTRTISPTWHIERDITDYAALLRTAHGGKAILGNLVNETYTGVISGSARLLFYPAERASHAAAVPDLVLPLNTENSPDFLNGPKDALARSLVFPRNTVQVYLDVIAESQGADEFWHLLTPDPTATVQQLPGQSAFREVEVSVDGKPAGIAPIFPWVYTGGMNPGLWKPLPGVQTLNFKPYRVNLTPFAGLLDDGQPHAVSVSVFNAHNGFLTTATLLVYTDASATQVNGALTKDTLTPQPSPSVLSNLKGPDTNHVSGPVSVTSNRTFVIGGYVLTSRGKVETTIHESASYMNDQLLAATATEQSQRTVQTTVTKSTTQILMGKLLRTARQVDRYDLAVDVDETGTDSKPASEALKVRQSYSVEGLDTLPGGRTSLRTETNRVESTVAIEYDTTGKARPTFKSQSRQDFTYTAPGVSFHRTMAGVNGRLVDGSK